MGPFWAYVYDFSGAVADEGLGEGFVRVDCRDIPGTNCYCDSDAAGEIVRRMEAAASDCLSVNWIDTGDYHYLSLFTVERFLRMNPGTPVDLVLFDRHPDMQPAAFGDILSCGGWVRSLLERAPAVRRAVIAGIDPKLMAECDMGVADGAASELADTADGQRVMVFPEGTEPDWSGLRGHKVYVSIDRDVLLPSEARTDWDQGSMTMDDLEGHLRSIAGLASGIAGVDICGGISREKGGTDADFALNRRSSIRIFNAIKSILYE